MKITSILFALSMVFASDFPNKASHNIYDEIFKVTLFSKVKLLACFSDQ